MPWWNRPSLLPSSHIQYCENITSMATRVHTHTELWGLHWHRLHFKVSMCNCWKKIKWSHVCNLNLLWLFLSELGPHDKECLRCVFAVCVMWVFETVAATGAAGTDWLHNPVCSLCLAPWTADSRPPTQTHTSLDMLNHMHAGEHSSSPTADGAGVAAGADMCQSILMKERVLRSSTSACLEKLLPLFSVLR